VISKSSNQGALGGATRVDSLTSTTTVTVLVSSPGEEPAAFAAWLNAISGWDGQMGQVDA
jgi:hypothetical protein